VKSLKLIALLIVLAGLLCSCLTVQADVSITKPTSASGQFDVTINVVDVANLDAGQFDLSYPSSMIRVKDVKDGSIAGTTVPIDMWSSINSNTIRVLFNLPGVSGVSGSGQLSVITFEVVGDAGDVAYLTLFNGLLTNTTAKEIQTTWQNSQDGITITAVTSTPTSTSSTPTPTSTSPDATPTPSISPTNSASPPPSDSGNISPYILLTVGVVICAIVVSSLYLVKYRNSSKPKGKSTEDKIIRSARPFKVSRLPSRLSITRTVSIVNVLLCLLLLFVPLLHSGVSAADAADAYTLGVYGNANQDDTINITDVTFIEQILLNIADATDLADANFDTKTNMLDVTQTELIMVGKEETLTVNMYTTEVSAGPVTTVPVTMKMPVTRIVSCSANHIATMRAMDVNKSTIVGVRKDVHDASDYFPEFLSTPDIGTGFPINYEAILALNPDLVMIWPNSYVSDANNLPGVPCVGFDCSNTATYVDEIMRLSYIINRVDQAKELVDFYNGIVNQIEDRVQTIPLADRPTVYYEAKAAYSTTGNGTQGHALITRAGGNNIFSDHTGSFTTDAEAVMLLNPDIIVKFARRYTGYGGYYLGSPESALADARNEIMNRPELANTNAVKNGKVYILDGDIVGATRNFIGMAYMAKWFYPDLFTDLDPVAIHIEYLTRFQGLPADFLDTQTGVFVYAG